MKRYLTSHMKAVAGLGVVLTLSGCAAFNIGESSYSCSGMPDGVQCMSTRDVYNLTNNGQVPNSVGDDAVKSARAVAGEAAGRGQDPHDVINTYVAPRLPDQPVPIRTPAQVMRIWVAPWEDTAGDLVVTGHIYTEVEPRRWVIGEQAANSQPSLRPLQSIQNDGGS